MENPDTLVFRSLDEIRRIIAEETWLEGERRGSAVSPHDAVVQENVRRAMARQGRVSRGAGGELVEQPEMEFQLIEAEELADDGEHHAAA